MDTKEVLVPDLVDRAQNAEQEVPMGWQGLQRHHQGGRPNQNGQGYRQEIIDDVWRQAYYLIVEGSSLRKNAQDLSGRTHLGRTHLIYGAVIFSTRSLIDLRQVPPLAYAQTIASTAQSPESSAGFLKV